MDQISVFERWDAEAAKQIEEVERRLALLDGRIRMLKEERRALRGQRHTLLGLKNNLPALARDVLSKNQVDGPPVNSVQFIPNESSPNSEELPNESTGRPDLPRSVPRQPDR